MVCTFRGENWYTWYCAVVMMACYAVGELGHFLIGIVSRPMAQDIEFGDKGCITNDTELQEKEIEKCRGSNHTSCSQVTSNGTAYCEWNYTGSGVQYQLLAGPAFIAVFSIMGIIIGIAGDIYNRVRLLTVCVFGYSLMTIITGFSTEYWQLLILRFGFGAGEAGCSPLTASIVADKFGDKSRALAMSIFNWGIYFGYGLAFTVGNYVTQANIMGKGWRWAYYLTGIPGFFMASLLFLTVKEPERREVQPGQARQSSDANLNASDALMPLEKVKPEKSSGFEKLGRAIRTFATNPAIMMLLLAASVRHTASFCWAYNTQLYFDYYYPGVDLGLWMLFCSIVGGSIGIASGGIISDFVVSKYGISTRLWVLVGSQAIASPFAAMVLYLPPPYCFITLLIAYLFAEMWFGILFTVMVEIFPLNTRSTSIALFIFVINNIASSSQLLVPALRPHLGFRTTLYLTYPGFYGMTEMWYGVVMTIFVEIVPLEIRSTAVALFAFVISNIGGNAPVLIAPLKRAVGGLRHALYIMYAGFYLLSSLLFLLTQLFIRRKTIKQKNSEPIDDSIKKE